MHSFRTHFLLTLLIFGSSRLLPAQSVSIPEIRFEKDSVSLLVNLYIDSYYSKTTGIPKGQRNLPYIYDAVRNNEVSLDVALLDFQANVRDRVRARVAPGFGTYFATNYAAEPEWARNLYEMSGGVRLSKSTWLDAGVLGSPFGWEGALCINNPTYTHSYTAENSPYYLTGARLGWTSKSGRAAMNAYLCNGWQHISTNANTKAAVLQFQYKPSSKLLINSATFAGDERISDTLSAKYRLFQDFYAMYTPNDRFSLLGVIDGGIERYGSSAWRPWHGGNIIARWFFLPKLGAHLRAEYYNDPNAIIVTSINPAATFRSSGASFGLDYLPYPNAMFRFEVHGQKAPSDIFLAKDGGYQSGNLRFTLAMNLKI